MLAERTVRRAQRGQSRPGTRTTVRTPVCDVGEMRMCGGAGQMLTGSCPWCLVEAQLGLRKAPSCGTEAGRPGQGSAGEGRRAQAPQSSALPRKPAESPGPGLPAPQFRLLAPCGNSDEPLPLPCLSSLICKTRRQSHGARGENARGSVGSFIESVPRPGTGLTGLSPALRNLSLGVLRGFRGAGVTQVAQLSCY